MSQSQQEAVDAFKEIIAENGELAALVRYYNAESEITPPVPADALAAEFQEPFIAVTFHGGFTAPIGIGAPGEMPYTEEGFALVYVHVPLKVSGLDPKIEDAAARALMRKILKAFLGQTRGRCVFETSEPGAVAEPWRGNWWRIGLQINYWLDFDL